MKPVKELTTPELIAEYNRLTGKSIKRFSSRPAGEKQVTAARAKVSGHTETARTIRGASGGRNGRPKLSFIILLTEDKAKSKPHRESDRAALIGWIRERELKHGSETMKGAATIEEIEKHFKKSMRGVVQKLEEKSWVKRIEIPSVD